MKVKTNDLKKGIRILLRNGWYGTLYDNKKGNIRLAEVEGFYTEIGSVYSHDIVEAQLPADDTDNSGRWVEIEYTKSQLQCRDFDRALF